MSRRAFTLIELLVVVAVIAILAAIAVPNFLEAQTRAKVSRAYADMRSVATGLEAYAVDNNSYPPIILQDGGSVIYAFLYAPYQLTSPISYISGSVLSDVFKAQTPIDPDEASILLETDPAFYRRFAYGNSRFWRQIVARTGSGWVDSDTGEPYVGRDDRDQGAWYLSSYGPDLKYGPEPPTRGSGANALTLYDPTNGTVSAGDIVRSQKDSKGKGVDTTTVN